MKILVIDNYDSFTFNLVQLIGEQKVKLTIKRNDEISVEDISNINPDKILISPGPGKPEDSKISLEAVKNFADQIPILGVCLGHQAIAINFGAKVIKTENLMHGKTSSIMHDSKTIFKDIEQNFLATRYHSLIIDRNSIPDTLEITSETEDGTVMGIRHKIFSVEGIQFHPESILTIQGKKIISNWLKQ